ncbi:MAG: lipoprotein insertase outer membrane protein LolB [Burkholderiaceae bacterium]|nr:lipoprotein insertase outer membrane protein LolB [Burkholderiaceae bacterium]
MNKAQLKINSTYSHYLRVLLGIILCAAFSACTSTKPLSQETLNKERQYQDNSQISGRISIQYQQNDIEQSVHANYDWLQSKNTLEINLSSPLGQTIAQITQNAQGARLEQAKQATLYAADIEQLLNDNLGWPLPANDLKIWLQGFDKRADGSLIAVPTQDNFQIHANGWTLNYAQWQEVNGKAHPKLIDLKRQTEQVGEVKIRVLITEWQ